MNNEKDSNKLVTIKEKIVTAVKENKKRTIAAALSLILGISVGTTKNISKEEHNNNSRPESGNRAKPAENSWFRFR